MAEPNSLDALTRPIIGIENRTAQESFDIMADRFRSYLASLPRQTAEPVAWRFKSDDPNYDDTYVYCATEKMALLRCPKNSEVIPLFAHPASPPVGGDVKPLEWHDGSVGPFAADASGRTQFYILGPKENGAYRLYGVDGPDDGGVEYATVGEAKAAAQADFEQRILSALASSERSGREVGLIEEHLRTLDSCLETFWCITREGTPDRLLAEAAIDAKKAIRNLAGTKTNG